jgi:hypothetical protein
MRSDTEMLTWMLGMLGLAPGVSDEESAHGKEAVSAALHLGLTAREAVSAAMGAVRIEPGQPLPPMTGVDLIAAERQRQIDVLGYDHERDATYAGGELASAASAYAIAIAEELHPQSRGGSGYRGHPPAAWPWPDKSWKFDRKNLIRAAVKAGGLIAAEIDRLRLLESNVSLEGNTFHDRVAPVVTLAPPGPLKIGDRVRLISIDEVDAFFPALKVGVEGVVNGFQPGDTKGRELARVKLDGVGETCFYVDQLERIG